MKVADSSVTECISCLCLHYYDPTKYTRYTSSMKRETGRYENLLYLLSVRLANFSRQADWMLLSLESHFHATNATHGILEACLLDQ
jgi:hypothetical protein